MNFKIPTATVLETFRTPLIRDWGDVFLELGDKQSLLASLKESQFFKAFEDQGITYEVRGGFGTSRSVFETVEVLLTLRTPSWPRVASGV